MTEKEAHAELVKIIAKVACGTSVNIEETEVGIWRNALKALEKQIPKKPIGFGGCPGCYQLMATSPNYCPYCGQKLDWSEE